MIQRRSIVIKLIYEFFLSMAKELLLHRSEKDDDDKKIRLED
jgi:hypothetical protein